MIPLALSPMAGFTTAPTRLVASRFGAWRTYTEMANAAGLARHSEPSWALLETLPDEPKPFAHLYGHNPDDFAHAAEMVAATGRFAGIDINAGCPAPKVVREGGGSALMREPELVGRIVRAASAASGLPVSVKTRIGYNPSEITVFRVVEEVAAAGAASVAVHGRYRAQGHSGPVALDILAEVKRRSTIPVFGNGGVRDFASANAMAEATGVDAILVGQGSVGHPWVFREIADGMSFDIGADRSRHIPLEEIRSTLLWHLDLEKRFIEGVAAKYPALFTSDTPEMICVIRFRLHLVRYLSGIRGAVRLRGSLPSIRSLDDVRAAIERVEREGREQIVDSG
ncbi:MAG: tRNA-dihydrouridine synthase family protein [Kiritimatiellae bacterium]|nr:tRNA-dihydrouridine synthase family protein [Kiritimatiellia bacterium]